VFSSDLEDGAPLTTDEGHHILDLHLGRIGDPVALAAALSALPGVVEHGLFIGMADQVVVGHQDGATEVLRSASAAVTEAMRNEDA
jgi:ribose 5-phosphate isomerase A